MLVRLGGILFEARGKGFATDYSKAGTDVVSTGIALRCQETARSLSTVSVSITSATMKAKSL
jgi:hypothetical protein